MNKKVAFGFFSENMSYPCSMLAKIVQDEGWEPTLLYFEDLIEHDEVVKRLKEAAPDVIAVSCRTFERNQGIKVGRAAKELGIPIIIGGIHATSCSDDLQQTELFNVIVKGDGAGVIVDLLWNAPMMSNEIVHGKKHPDPRKYIYRVFSESQIQHIIKTKNLEILTSFGCPWECTYCANTSDGMKGFLKLPLEETLGEMARLVRLYDVKTILINDDTFGLSIKRVKEFRRIIEEQGLELTFRIQTRVDCFSEEHAKEYKRIGVNDILFGIETPSQKLSDFLDKRISTEDIYKAVDVCRKYKLPFNTNLIFGLPKMDEEDYQAAVDFVNETKPDNLTIYYFIPLPGSVLFPYCVENDHMPDGFNFEEFYDIRTVGDGIRETPGKLKNIDYDMARRYFEIIDNRESNAAKTTIIDVAKKCDDKKWVIFGTQRYFRSCIELLTHHEWKNCMGYFDYAEASELLGGGTYVARGLGHGAGKHLIARGQKQKQVGTDIRQFDPHTEEPPERIIVTVPLDVTFFAHTLPIIKEYIGEDFDGDIVSASTFTMITTDADRIGFDMSRGDFFSLEQMSA